MQIKQIRIEILESLSIFDTSVQFISLRKANGEPVIKNGYAICSTATADFPPENAFDDNLDTFWASESADNQFIGWHYDEPLDIQPSDLPLYLTVYCANENAPRRFQVKLILLNPVTGMEQYNIADNATELICFKNNYGQLGDFVIRQLQIRNQVILLPKEKRQYLKDLKLRIAAGNTVTLESIIMNYVGNYDKADKALMLLESCQNPYADLFNAGFSKTQSSVIASMYAFAYFH